MQKRLILIVNFECNTEPAAVEYTDVEKMAVYNSIEAASKTVVGSPIIIESIEMFYDNKETVADGS
jgi:hypothetical protein